MKELTFEEVQLIEEVYNYEKPHKEYYRISKTMVEIGVVDATLAKLLNEEFNLYLKEKVKLNDDDKELFMRLYNLLDDIEDVTDIYHNVILD